MAVACYGSPTDSSGVVRILKDLDAPIEGRHVLIVEDIIDSGLTLHYLMRNLRARNPAIARGLRAADQAGAPPGRPPPATSGSRSPTASRSATASTTPSVTATSLRRGADVERMMSRARGPPWYAALSSAPTVSAFLFKSAAFPILLVVILAFVAQKFDQHVVGLFLPRRSYNGLIKPTAPV